MNQGNDHGYKLVCETNQDNYEAEDSADAYRIFILTKTDND
jgi:hypothetical protein